MRAPPSLCRTGWCWILCNPCFPQDAGAVPCPCRLRLSLPALPRGTICSAARKRHSRLRWSQSCIQTSERISVLALSLVLTHSLFSDVHFSYVQVAMCGHSYYSAQSQALYPILFHTSQSNTTESRAIPVSLFHTIQRTLSPSLYGFHNEPAEPLGSENSFFSWVLMLPYGSFVHCQTSCRRALPLFVLCFCNQQNFVAKASVVCKAPAFHLIGSSGFLAGMQAPASWSTVIPLIGSSSPFCL